MKKRKKRSTSSGSTDSGNSDSSSSTTTTTTSSIIKLKKSNSASTLLGLSILLYPESRQYEMGMNNYYGFRVRFFFFGDPACLGSKENGILELGADPPTGLLMCGSLRDTFHYVESVLSAGAGAQPVQLPRGDREGLRGRPEEGDLHRRHRTVHQQVRQEGVSPSGHRTDRPTKDFWDRVATWATLWTLKL